MMSRRITTWVGLFGLGLFLMITKSESHTIRPPRLLWDRASGPYKVLSVDLTNDNLSDMIVSYVGLDAISVERNTSQFGFERLNLFQIPKTDSDVREPIFNLDVGDLDKDGLADLAVGLGGAQEIGVPESFPGRAVLLKNLGAGRFKKMVEFPVESQAKGIRLADLNQDGVLDLLYTARGSAYPGDIAVGKLIIRKGLGQWRFGKPFEYEAGLSAYYVETTDVNGDGFPDIFIPNEHSDKVTYFLNPGNKLFTGQAQLIPMRISVSQLPGPNSARVNDVRVADFNQDGKPDLVTANLGASTISVFFGKGDGTFYRDTLLDGGKDCTFLAVGDLNSDGAPDFVVTHWTTDQLSVFINDGTGKFPARKDYRVGFGNYGVNLSHLDDDGNLDLITANYQDNTLSVLKGVGDGTFELANTVAAVPQ